MPKVFVVGGIFLFFLSGCALGPYKIPMAEQAKNQFSSPTIYLKVVNDDIGVQYFEQDVGAYASQYGVVGSITAAIVQGMVNSPPNRLAQQHADEMHKLLGSEPLSTQLASAFQVGLHDLPSFFNGDRVTVINTTSDPSLSLSPDQSVLVATVEYSLTADFRALQTSLNIELYNKRIANSAPRGAATEAQHQQGLLFRNRFIYLSEQLTDPEDKWKRLVEESKAAIHAKYQGQLNHPGMNDQMNAELLIAERAMPLEWSANELTKQWMANDGVLLKAKMTQGVVGALQLFCEDIRDTHSIPSDTRIPPRVLRQDAERKVYRIYMPTTAGSVTSEPTTFVHAQSNATAHGQVADSAGKEK